MSSRQHRDSLRIALLSPCWHPETEKLLACPRRGDLVEGAQEGMGRCFHRVGTDAQAVVGLVVVRQCDMDFGLRILTVRYATNLIVLLGCLDSRQFTQHFEQGVDGTVTGGDADAWQLLAELDLDAAGRDGSRSAECLETEHLPQIGPFGRSMFDQGDDVGVVDVLLLVAQHDEVAEQLLEGGFVQLIMQR